MISEVNLTVILMAAFVATVSPGPATLALAGTSMARGREAGLLLASGITTGSLIWSVSAAAGLSAVMMTNLWLFELCRYLGAAYLLYLAYKSARAAISSKGSETREVKGSLGGIYLKGLALHLTNPKAIFFFGSLYSIGVPPNSSPAALAIVVIAVGVQSVLLFHFYAVLFSIPALGNTYVRLRRWFEAVFAMGFGIAGAKVLTARIE